MPTKKSQNENKKTQSKKGRKGGQSSRTNRQKGQDMNNPVEYIEVDEFTIDDIPSSRS